MRAQTPFGTGSFVNQVDHSDTQYMEGIAITDNVSPAAYSIQRSQGTGVSKGIGGNPGLANTYAVNSCRGYFTVQAPDGDIAVDNTQDFTFSGLPGAATNYMVSLNGQYIAISNATPTSFTVSPAAACGGSSGGYCTNAQDTIVVRDLNECNWTFHSNLLGMGNSGISGISPNFLGAGKDTSPYPNLTAGVPSTYLCGAGGTQSCILDEGPSAPGAPGNFINNFVNWGTGRNGDFSIASASPYFNTASDALTRPATGKSPGADFTLLAAKTAGVRGATFLPALTITTSTLSGNLGLAYNAQLQASFGASQFWNGYKSWFRETEPSLCGVAQDCGSLNNGAAHSGLVIGRAGIVNGPFEILNVSRSGCPSACVSNFALSMTIVGGLWEVGQTASLTGFLDCTTNCTANNTQDGSFNGICTITAFTPNAFSCQQAGDIAGTNTNKPTHVGYSAKTCGPNGNFFCGATGSFAPISAGTYTFWVGARDGAFQVARAPVTVVVGP